MQGLNNSLYFQSRDCPEEDILRDMRALGLVIRDMSERHGFPLTKQDDPFDGKKHTLMVGVKYRCDWHPQESRVLIVKFTLDPPIQKESLEQELIEGVGIYRERMKG
jgi:hypothetical protein